MRPTKFDFMLHQVLVYFKDLDPEINVQEKHGSKNRYDGKKQEIKHGVKGSLLSDYRNLTDMSKQTG